MDSRLRTSLIAVALLAPVIFFGALAVAAGGSDNKIAKGVSIQGISVGGMTPEEAKAQLQAQIGDPASKPIRVKIPKGVFKLDPAKAGMKIDIDAAVAQAKDLGKDDGFISKGWRKITGGEVDKNVSLTIASNRKAVLEFVKGMERKLSRKPENATLDIKVDRVTVKPHTNGRRLAAMEQLKRQLNEALVNPAAPRTLTAKLRTVRPPITEGKVFDKTPTVVTVTKSGATVRVFKRGEMIKSYGVSVGSDQYPTTEGLFSVQSKQVNPTWSVPNSSWAGSLAGQVIPGGAANNPLKARWIGFNGSEGFHGSTSVGGAARSHGCVRMVPAQVIDLYDRVEVGTPVLIAA